MSHFRVVGCVFQGQDPPLRALHGLQKSLKIDVLGPRMIWAGENETLKKSGVFLGGTLSSHAEKREFVLEMSGSGTNNSLQLRHFVHLHWCVFDSVLRVVESSVHLRWCYYILRSGLGRHVGRQSTSLTGGMGCGARARAAAL